ncbi:RNA polymerase sigma factor [Puniceicoccaceae bacterium K14]|nr:RNA polymerase sigma factor [Puniceicoccaceae bacterium K14]
MSDLQQTDSTLMKALQKGDEQALPILIKRWERPLFNFAYRYLQNSQTASDIVEETLVRIFTKRQKYNPKYPLSTWLFTIAANLCKNHSRWLKRHPEQSWESNGDDDDSLPLKEKIACQQPSPIESSEREEQLQQLRGAIDELPHELKTTLLLHYYEGLSYQEISEISKCSVRGVETRLYRARKLLKSNCSKLGLST